MRPLRTVGLTAMTFLLCAAAAAQESPNRVDATTLTGKVMWGYQGWFNCDGDGADLGWTHWAQRGDKPFAAGNVTVDLWPDVSELGETERFATGLWSQVAAARRAGCQMLYVAMFDEVDEGTSGWSAKLAKRSAERSR